ncbi:MAG TPA: response regulator [Planctomycetota bacterium]|nr:response regulator [Planctomycetota bacterium]
MGERAVSTDAVLWMVDDNPADLEIGGIVCETIGFPGHFVPFATGQEMLETLAKIWTHERQRPDVILLDVNMPRMSGLAVLRALRQDQRWAALPIVMFTTSANEEQVARRDGATDYVIKPDLLMETMSAIRGVIARYCKVRVGP